MLIVVPLLVSASLFSYGLDQVVPLRPAAGWASPVDDHHGLSVYFGLWVIACGARWVARRIVLAPLRGGGRQVG